MMTPRPAAEALSAIEDRVDAGHHASHWVHAQLAVVRSLVDELERRTPHVDELRRQIQDELARLVARLDEADAMTAGSLELPRVA